MATGANLAKASRRFRDGWFHTGDLGFLDDERYLFVVDRKKDMVVTGGVNVYTKEVEAVLYAAPGRPRGGCVRRCGR